MEAKVITINEVHYPSTGWKPIKTGGKASMHSWIQYYKGMGVDMFNLVLENEQGQTMTTDINADDV